MRVILRLPALNPSPSHSYVTTARRCSFRCPRLPLRAEFGGSREAAPAFDPDMQLVLEFELPCPPPEVFHRFLSNGSTFPHEFHTARGDSNIRLSKWSRHYKVRQVVQQGVRRCGTVAW